MASHEIYVIHHARREGKTPNPPHAEWGRQQLHIARNIMSGLITRPGAANSTLTPAYIVKRIYCGRGRRFHEIAEKIMEDVHFKDAQLIEEPLLGGEEAVFEEDGKEYVLTGDGKIFPRESYQLPSDLPGIQERAWAFVESVEETALPHSCSVFCSGKQYLLMLGLKPEEIKGGCLFRISNIQERKVLRIIGY